MTTSKRHFGLAVATLGLLAALVVGLVTWLNVAFYAGFVPSAHASAGDQWCGCIDFGGAIVLGGFALVGLGALVVWALTQVGS